jgi:hypothetical protein
LAPHQPPTHVELTSTLYDRIITTIYHPPSDLELATRCLGELGPDLRNGALLLKARERRYVKTVRRRGGGEEKSDVVKRVIKKETGLSASASLQAGREEGEKDERRRSA